jgi:YHS domain-containing protein
MKILFFVISIAIMQINAIAQQDFAVRKRHFNIDKQALAIQGYDPVSYFYDKPDKGNSQFFIYHKGVKYLFNSKQNLELFKATPDKYEPAYGGWCAYAMGKYGEKVEVDPLKYKIVDGKTNLFYYSVINNTLTKWSADENNLKPLADKNWNQTINK